MDADLAGISVSKYQESVTIDPDDLRVGSGSSNLQSGMQQSRSNASNAYGGFASSPDQYQVPSAPSEANTASIGTHTRRHMNTVHETHAPLNLLADTALASPPASVSQSRHTYSSGLSSNFEASPDKSMFSDDQKSTEGTSLTKAFKAFVKELGTASDDQKDSVLRALQEASEEPSDNIGDISQGSVLRRNPQSGQSSFYDGRHTVYGCAQSDGSDGRGDSTSEQEELRRGLAVIAKGLKEARSSKDRQKSKSPTREFRCEQQNCDKVFPRKCQLTLVSSLLSSIPVELTTCRKHLKRHTRPYACVFPACYKAFGSKVGAIECRMYSRTLLILIRMIGCVMSEEHITRRLSGSALCQTCPLGLGNVRSISKPRRKKTLKSISECDTI
jgi:hypothetical protein